MTARPDATLGADLLPCPFCGSEKIDVYVQDGISWAACTECRAEGPPCDVEGGKAWNGRAALAAPAVAVSAEPVAAPELPPLPECDSYCTHKDLHEYDVWSADQMRAYATEAVLAALASTKPSKGAA